MSKKPTPDPTTEYARRVVAGKILAGKFVIQACQRHLRDLETGAQRGLRFSITRANYAIKLFTYFRHSKGEWAGRPIVLDPWEEFIVGSLFGWLRADGFRRFRVSYTEVARKNGKSTVASGIGLLLAFFDNEPGAEVYAAATKRDQAKIVWSEARRMVRKSESLRSRITTLASSLTIESTASKFEPLGGDKDSTDGLNVHGAIVDELHAHKNAGMWEVITTATGARRQPMIFAITTAGQGRHSVCWDQHEYGVRVLNGIVEDDTFFVFMASIDEKDDWKDPKVWGKANPNLGISVKLDDLERKCKAAIEMPSRENAFKRLHLGVWTEQVTRWIPVERWDQCPKEAAFKKILRRRCVGAYDLSANTDLSSFCFAPIPESGDEVVPFFWRFWLPEDNLDAASRRDGVPYEKWVRDGWLETTPGDSVDQKFIEARIEELATQIDFDRIGGDPWNASQFRTNLMDDGFELVDIRQGFGSLSAPSKEFERWVLAKRIDHGDNPIMRWMVSNVSVKQDPAGNIKPDKSKSTSRIDGVVTGIMVTDLLSRSNSDTLEDGRGLLVIGGEQ